MLRSHVVRCIAPLLVALTPLGRVAHAQTLFGEVRTRSELDHPSGQSDDAFTYLRSRLGLRVDPAEGTRIVLQVQDSRVLGTEGSTVASAVAMDQLELHQGYLQVGMSSQSATFGLRAGRQEIGLGNERLVGAVNWSNLGRSFDGARLSIAPQGAAAGAEPWTAVAFAAVVSEQGRRFGAPATITHDPRDHVMGGAYFTLGAAAGTSFDATVLLDAGGQYRSYDAADRGTVDLRIRVPRLTPALPIRLELEGAYQAGHQLFVGPASAPVPGAAQTVRAWLIGARLGASLEKTTFTLGADVLSGDDAPNDAHYTAFNTLYATNHPFYGLMDVIGDPATTTHDRGLLDIFGTTITSLTSVMSLRTEVHHFALATGTDRPLGWEGDLVFPIKLNGATTIDAGAALFRGQRGAQSVGITADGSTSAWTYLQLVVGF